MTRIKSNHKAHYASPRIVGEANVRLERSFLKSVVDKMEQVQTTGQEVQGEYDYQNSSSSFKTDWQ